MAIVKLAKKPEWTIGWKPTILTGASTLVIDGVAGYVGVGTRSPIDALRLDGDRA